MSRGLPYNQYHFTSTWSIPHPIDSVWSALIKATEYPHWWGNVYNRVERLNGLAGGQVGAMAQVEAHGRLPYKIRFRSEITYVCAPHLLTLSSKGDLNGVGKWQLKEHQNITEVAFDWAVEADKPILRILSPVLKPLFAWNHRWTMRQGEVALCKHLHSQLKKSKGIPEK